MSKIKEALAFQQKKEDNVDMDVSETCSLKPYREEHRNTHHEGGNEGNNSDEDDENGHHQRGGVRCQQ